MELIISLGALLVIAVLARKELETLRKHIFEVLYNHRDKLNEHSQLIEELQNRPVYVPPPVVEVVAEQPKSLPVVLPVVLPSIGHTLIVGKSGSGKSNVAMLEIINRLKLKHLLYIVDTKQEMGPIFAKHCVEVVGTEGATDMMQKLLKVAKERRDKFTLASAMFTKPCRDYKEYERLTGEKMPVITLVLEELIVLMGRIEQNELIELLVVGRSAGVFVFALAQYLKSDILDRKGSVNFMTRVFLGRWDRIGISILFGSIRKIKAEEYMEYLGQPGRALIETEGKDLELFTFPRIEDAELEEWMK